MTSLLSIFLILLFVLPSVAQPQPPSNPSDIILNPSPTVTLTVQRNGVGRVTGPGIDCGTDCDQQLSAGSTVTLQITELPGSTFSGWGGACTGTFLTCDVTMTEAKIAIANFTLTTIALNLTKAGTGTGTVTFTPPGTSCGPACPSQSVNYAPDTSVSLTQNASANSQFAGWSVDCSGTGACTPVMTQTRSVTATFNLVQTFALTVTKTGTGAASGTISSSPLGVTCGASTCTGTFAQDQQVILNASGGATFNGWSGEGCSGTGTCTVIMSQARNVSAAFTAVVVAGCTPANTSDGSVNNPTTGTQAKIDAAAPNGTVCIPAGTFSWGAQLSTTKPITLKGSGVCTGATTFTNRLGVVVTKYDTCPTKITNNFATGHLIIANEQSTGNITIRDIWFAVGTGPVSLHANCEGGGACAFVRIPGAAVNGQPVIVSHNLFSVIGNNTIVKSASNHGVIAKNTAIGIVGSNCDNTGAILRAVIGNTWATPSSFGTADALFIENNYIVDVYQNDFDESARGVYRGNIMPNGHIGGHGWDSSTYGTRQREIYYNDFTWQKPNNNGTSCLTSDTGNITDYVHGRGGGPARIFYNSGKATTSGSYGADTITIEIWSLAYAGKCWGASTETAGQSYPAPHQPGWGWNTAGSGATGACAPHVCPTQAESPGSPMTTHAQDPDPLYLWGNCTGIGPIGPGCIAPGEWSTPNITTRNSGCSGGPPISTYLMAGRDYVMPNSTPGTSIGLLSARPACSPTTFPAVGFAPSRVQGPFYWATDQGSWNTISGGPQGVGYACGASGWQSFYTPYTFPHPQVQP